MKKKGLLFLPLLAAFALGGCDLFGGGDDAWIVKPEITGGTKAEKNAILTAVNNLSVCTTKAGSDLFPTATNIRFKEDEQDYIRVLNKVKVDDLTVELTWDFKKSQSTFDSVVSPDKGVTNFVYLKYPGYEGKDSTYKWSITKIKCGGATSTKTNCDYKATVVHGTHAWTPMTMEKILEVGDQGSDYVYNVSGTDHKFESISTMINYESLDKSGKYSPWWDAPESEDGEKYFYVEVKGKITFLSEDGNWGLLQNGSHVLELYSGDQLDLNVASYPEIANEYVVVKGEVNHGYGNFQMSYIKSIRAIAKSEVTEPTKTFTNLTDTMLGNAKLREPSSSATKKQLYKQFTNQFEHNQLVSLTGTVTTAKVNDGTSGRFLIGVTPSGGSHEIFIAYDYHTDREKQDVKAKILEVYGQVYKNGAATGTLKVQGTLRFSHAQQKVLVPADGSGGTWDIVPFSASHISKVS